MHKTIRSLYVRVLRGKYDRGRGDPKYMRDIAAELDWFYYLKYLKKELSEDPLCPEEVYHNLPSARAPRCYKWAQQFLVSPSEEILLSVKAEAEAQKIHEASRKKWEAHRKRMELINKNKKAIKSFASKIWSRIK